MRTGLTRAHQNRAVRQKELRDKLAAGGHLQHMLEITGKLANLKESLDSVEVTRLKAAADNHYRLLDKYLPNLKPVDGEESSDLVMKITVSVDE